MAKQGMKRPEISGSKNTLPPVPGISGKAKSGKEPARPLIAGAEGKVYHSTPHAKHQTPVLYPVMDNDLASENLLNDFDMTAADLQDLQ